MSRAMMKLMMTTSVIYDDDDDDDGDEHDDEGNGRIPDNLLATIAYMHLAVNALAYKELLDEAPKRKMKE